MYRVRQDASQDQHIEGLPLGTVGGTAVEPTLPLDGEYELPGQAVSHQPRHDARPRVSRSGWRSPSTASRCTSRASAATKRSRASSDNPTTTGNAVDERLRVRLPLTAGPHKITVAFLAKPSVQGGRRLQPWQRSSSDTVDFAGLSARGHVHGRGTVQPDRRRRHAEPPRHLHLPPRDCRRDAPARAGSSRP